MRSLIIEIELKREQESLMSAKAGLDSMSDEEFRQYFARVSQYIRGLTRYISHLSDDELQQFNKLESVHMLSRGMEKDVVCDGTRQVPNGDGVGTAPDTSIMKSLEDPVEVR